MRASDPSWIAQRPNPNPRSRVLGGRKHPSDCGFFMRGSVESARLQRRSANLNSTKHQLTIPTLWVFQSCAAVAIVSLIRRSASDQNKRDWTRITPWTTTTRSRETERGSLAPTCIGPLPVSAARRWSEGPGEGRKLSRSQFVNKGAPTRWAKAAR